MNKLVKIAKYGLFIKKSSLQRLITFLQCNGYTIYLDIMTWEIFFINKGCYYGHYILTSLFIQQEGREWGKGGIREEVVLGIIFLKLSLSIVKTSKDIIKEYYIGSAVSEIFHDRQTDTQTYTLLLHNDTSCLNQFFFKLVIYNNKK